jgi:uncharacterized protein (TIGR02147 family)
MDAEKEHRPSPFTYGDPIAFLSDSHRSLRAKEPSLTLAKWAGRMGLRSPELLTLLLRRKKPLRLKHLGFLLKGLDLDASEQTYLKALVYRACARSAEEAELWDLLLARLNPGLAPRLEPATELFSHWLHAVVLTLGETLSHVDEHSVLAALRAPATSEEVRHAITTLQGFGLLQAGPDGRLRTTYQRVTSRNDVSHAGAKAYVRQVSALAAQAVSLPVQEREFQCFALAMNPDRLHLYKEIIRSFRSQMAQLSARENGTTVYQVNFQMFPVSHDLKEVATGPGKVAIEHPKPAESRPPLN